MARFLLMVIVLGGTAYGFYATKPTRADYMQKLESRSRAIASVEGDGFARLRGGDPFDEMVATGSPAHLLEHTYTDDYIFFSVFTTEYQATGHSLQRIRTYGVFSTLFSVKEQD